MTQMQVLSRLTPEPAVGASAGPRCPFASLGTDGGDMAAYEASLRLLSVPYEPLDLSGACGHTHVVVSGPRQAPPVVLLHCNWTGLTRLSPKLADLSQSYRVYAVDVMDRMVTSDVDHPSRNRADLPAWLTATIDELGLASTHLVRMSLAGWLTLGRQGDECLDWFRSLPGVCFLVSDSDCGERCNARARTA
jgi:hypothetical protein